jgi:hypothetical protein
MLPEINLDTHKKSSSFDDSEMSEAKNDIFDEESLDFINNPDQYDSETVEKSDPVPFSSSHIPHEPTGHGTW